MVAWVDLDTCSEGQGKHVKEGNAVAIQFDQVWVPSPIF